MGNKGINLYTKGRIEDSTIMSRKWDLNNECVTRGSKDSRYINICVLIDHLYLIATCSD